jgi:hypothetical protein
MTVIIAYASSTHAFLAADSFRWDWKQKRNLGPVRKLTEMGDASWAAMGGSYIDRTRLACEMARAHRAGEPLPDSARRLSPALFAIVREIMEKVGNQEPQFLRAFYAQSVDGRCSLSRHDLPADKLDRIEGLAMAGPDTPWLEAECAHCLPTFVTEGCLALDALTYHLIGRAADRHPQAVGYPAMAVMLQADGVAHMREDLHPDCWSEPRTEYRVAYP